MYFSIGWPKYLDFHEKSSVKHVFCNRDRSLFGILSEESISLWFARPCVETTCYRRSKESLCTDGLNHIAEWRPDSSMIVVSTNRNCLMFYNVEVDESVKGLYEQYDSKVAGLRRESAELFTREKVPPIALVPTHRLVLPGFSCCLVCIRDELMASSDAGQIWRLSWDGTIDRDYSLDLHNIPFCLDQQQSKGSHFDTQDISVIDLEYSPLIGGFSSVLSNGRASFITASTLKFHPSRVFGILAPDINNAVCTAVNHRYRLIAYGLKSAEAVVFSIDDVTGALQIAHRLALSSKDFPDVITAAGQVTNLKWTPDGGALAMTWQQGGLAVWSVFGALIVCTLGWDYGSTDVMKHVLKISSLEWGPEGYHLWAVGEKPAANANMKTPEATEHSQVAILQFAKTALTVNPGMTGREHVFLQAEDKLYISAGSEIIHNTVSYLESASDPQQSIITQDQMVVGNKQWIIVSIPYSYLGSNWPIRYTALDSMGDNIAVAGRSGLAHYSLTQKRWKLFGNETQEKDFVVMGGLLWWEDQIIVGCYNLRDLQDEIRIYPQESKLDNQFVRIVRMSSQVLQLSCLGERLLCFCADSHLTLFRLQRKTSPTNSVLHVCRILELDVANLVFHPACVISALLTSLCTEAGHRSRKGDESILLNVCGRLLLLQQDPTSKASDVANNNNQESIPRYSAPTVLASSVENIWVSSHTSKEAPHLSDALWIACGCHGMRVWLPLFPRDGEKPRTHNFMSKRIMLPVNVQIYPLAVLFEDAVVLGAENDTVLFSVDSYSKQPFCVISRNSQVYLHHILRQLLRRNLGYHAWEIARSCMTLPYFPHSLELLLHEVLEEEATSSEPIPDALLPRVIDFIQEFPVFLQTVVQCARKTELALWPYLFSAVGNPKNLFRACLHQGQLETAASYLIILQNLELSSVSHQHATILLDNALEAGKWELANELIRFLKAIDPSDVESPPRSITLPNKYGLTHPTPPVTPTEDDLSFVLGTLSVTRGRSHSAIVPAKPQTIPTDNINWVPHQDIARTTSDPHNFRKRRTSEHKEKSISEEFFIDDLLASHARKLLSEGKLKDLGYMAAHLDFHLVTFFMKEKDKSAQVSNFISALHFLHKDFQWPYPVQPVKFPLNFHPKSPDSVSLMSSNVACNMNSSANGVPKVTDSEIFQNNEQISDQSGRISIKSENGADSSLQTIDCYLTPKATKENGLLVFDISENSSLWAEDSQTTVEEDCWANQPLSADLEALAEDLASRGPQQTEVQLRYLLQLLLEAGCLEWSLLISVILRDAMAVIRVLNATNQLDQTEDAAKRLREGLAAIEQWAEKECKGYKLFMLSIHNQARMLCKVGTSTPSVLKIEPLSSDDFYTSAHYADQSDHRLSTSSDIPSIDGTLVLQNSGTEMLNDDSSESEAEDSVDTVKKPEPSSDCIIS